MPLKSFQTPLFTKACLRTSHDPCDPSICVPFQTKLTNMDHRYICPITQYANPQSTVIHLKGGRILVHCDQQAVTEDQVWLLLTSITSALNIIQTKGYTHRHISADSIIMGSDGSFRLIFLPQIQPHIDQQAKTPNQVYWLLATVIYLMTNSASQSSQPRSSDIKSLLNELQKSHNKYSSRLVDFVSRNLVQTSQNPIRPYRLHQEIDKVKNQGHPQTPIYTRNTFGTIRKEQVRRPFIETVKDSRTTSQNEHNEVPSPVHKPQMALSQTLIPLTKLVQKSSLAKSQYVSEEMPPQPITIDDQTPQIEILKGELKRLQTQTKAQQNAIKIEVDAINKSIQPVIKRLSQMKQMSYKPLLRYFNTPGVFINGNLYYGQLQGGQRHGFGLQVFVNGDYYIGSFHKDLFHGEGVYFWSGSKDHFMGRFKDGKKIQGFFIHTKGTFLGRFRQNKLHGFGIETIVGAERYEGYWEAGKRQGIGLVQYSQGGQYIGEWKIGKRRGLGTEKNDGVVLYGEWEGQEIIGQMLSVEQNGQIYKGCLVEGKREGPCELLFKKGDYLKGVMRQNQMASGSIQFANGDRYIGEFKELRRHGKGSYYYAEKGNWKTGMWKNGKYEGETF